MLLRTLGGVALEGVSFGRPKPLLLLAYLSVEGPKSRRFMSELLWSRAAQPMNSLRVALSQVRNGAPGALIEGNDRLECAVPSDVQKLLASLEVGEITGAMTHYGGVFLEGFDVRGAAATGSQAELEEWVFATREYLAERLRTALLTHAERDASLGDFAAMGRRAEAALEIAGAPPLEPQELERLHRLLVAAGSSRAAEVVRGAREYGLELELAREEARAQLAPDRTSHPIAPNNLPSPLTEFVGRDPEQLELARLLADPGTRLVTIIGLGGVGKTRLALQVAHSEARGGRFPDGVYFVPLDSLNDVTLVPAAVASALAIQLPSRANAVDELTDLLRQKNMLIVLDNCEHLSGVDRIAARLIADCPHLTLLTTSRERICLPAEQLFPLDGLRGTESISEPMGWSRDTNSRGADGLQSGHEDAVRLFVQQGKRLRPGFDPSPQEIEDIRAICRLVHGFPLGIELAAARLRLMTTAELAQEMQQGLDFLDGASGALTPRHHGLRAAFDHSWRLLTPLEARTLRRLSVFTGGFTREAAARVVGATIPLLAALVDKSLLRTDDAARFDRHPLVHQYTTEQLAGNPDELASTREAHLAWFTTFAEEANEHTTGDAQRLWLERLEKEQNNLRAALGWALADDAPAGRTMLGLQLAVALYRFWYFRSHIAEGRRWLRMATDRSEAVGEAALPLRSKALHAAGVLADVQGDRSAAKELFEARLALADKLDDALGEAATLNSLGVVLLAEKEYARARELLERSLHLRECLGRHELLATPRLNLGLVALAQQDYRSAQEHFEYGWKHCREVGDDMGSAIALTNLGAVYIDRGLADEAEAAFSEAAELYQLLGNKDGLGHCLDGFASIAVLRRCFDFAARLSGGSASLYDTLGASPENEQVERRIRPAQEALGDEKFEALRREGYELGYEEMLGRAMDVRARRQPSSRPH